MMSTENTRKESDDGCEVIKSRERIYFLYIIEKSIMIRANIRNSEDVFIGLIDEDDNGFRIVWNRNMDDYPEYNRLGCDGLFQSFEEACQGVYRVSQDAEISETIYYKPKNR